MLLVCRCWIVDGPGGFDGLGVSIGPGGFDGLGVSIGPDGSSAYSDMGWIEPFMSSVLECSTTKSCS